MLKLIGHRGLPQRSPENTVASLRMALEAGADAIECDVQLSAAGRPYLFHDAVLDRVSGESGVFFDKSEMQLSSLTVHEPLRFGARFEPTALSALSDVCPLLHAFKQAKIFVEIKSESLSCHTCEFIVDTVKKAIEPIKAQAIIISYDLSLIEYAREKYGFAIGWVLPGYDDEHKVIADRLKPDYLFCDVEKLGDERPWVGNWEWAVYDLVSSTKARSLYARGVAWVESWDVHTLKRGLAIG